MRHIHTHYDNLMVARNATPEVIRAAYKTLSQKFHPDRNPDVPNATQTFQLIHVAYEVLSDPERRREHDAWIEEQEAQDSAADAARLAHAMPHHPGIEKPPPIAPRAGRRTDNAWRSALRMATARPRGQRALHLLLWAALASCMLLLSLIVILTA